MMEDARLRKTSARRFAEGLSSLGTLVLRRHKLTWQRSQVDGWSGEWLARKPIGGSTSNLIRRGFVYGGLRKRQMALVTCARMGAGISASRAIHSPDFRGA